MGNCSSSTLGEASSGSEAEWIFDVGRGATTWDWSMGAPPIELLRPVRAPSSTARSRHAPVHAYSVTMGEELHLESGFEHDLLRVLDRRPEVRWLLPQPCRLRLKWTTTRVRVLHHVPDLLSAATDGTVTLWDVRPLDDQDDKFLQVTALTEVACEEQGWGYETFGGLGLGHRLNLSWLHAYRHQEPWHQVGEAQLRQLACDSKLTARAVEAADSTGHLLSTLWHLVWADSLGVDLSRPITSTTEILFRD